MPNPTALGFGDELPLDVPPLTVDSGRGFRLRKLRVAARALLLPPLALAVALALVDDPFKSTDAFDPRRCGEGAEAADSGARPCVETVETEPSSLGGGGCEEVLL